MTLFVPDLKGRTLEEAKDIINKSGLTLGSVSEVAGTPSGDKMTEVEDQVPEAGSEARFGNKINLSVMKKESVTID
jgi:beta-lactam-binding protein with PASTA domain